MGNFRIIFGIFTFMGLLLFSCNTSQEKKIDETTQNEQKEALTWVVFDAGFDEMRLPIFFPPDEGIQVPYKSISSKLIATLFSKKPFEWAMGLERDVPNLSEHSDSATKFSAIGKTYTKDSNVVYAILKKKDGINDFYYYLITTTKTGEYISGMCLSFLEGDNENSLGRTASINTDLSIEIAQSEYSKGKRSTPQTAFFEIDHKGKINAIKRQQ